MKKLSGICLLSLLFVCLALAVAAQPSAPQVLSSNMVLQQGKAVPVWGAAEPGEKIEVSFAGQKVSTRAGKEGKWAVELKPMDASAVPRSMTIKGRSGSVVFDNILVGEVWLCSGQSNMEYTMRLHPSFARPAKGEDLTVQELAKPANDLIRVFLVGRGRNASSTWKVADGESLVSVSAAGYFFAKKIMEETGVPVGIISASVGGTRIEPWTSAEAYRSLPLFALQLESGNGQIDGAVPGALYESMIAPLAPFALRGFLWYQGESNCSQRDRQYAEKYEVMVNSWRSVFGAADAPFYSVMLGPHIYSDRLHKGTAVTAEELPLFWRQQVKALDIQGTDMAVVTDLIDDLTDIHPSYKWEVGERLARLALAKNYGKEGIIWSGPRLAGKRIEADSVILKFEHLGEGLKTNDGKRLNWFEIAGGDGVFHPALADIRGTDMVVVYHPDIKNPKRVRFCWHETAIANLVNSEGLPAMPFGVE